MNEPTRRRKVRHVAAFRLATGDIIEARKNRVVKHFEAKRLRWPRRRSFVLRTLDEQEADMIRLSPRRSMDASECYRQKR